MNQAPPAKRRHDKKVVAPFFILLPLLLPLMSPLWRPPLAVC